MGIECPARHFHEESVIIGRELKLTLLLAIKHLVVGILQM